MQFNYQIPLRHLGRSNEFVFVPVLPKDGPTISGVKPQYQVGDDVNVTCSAGPSKPAAQLRWYINGHEAPSEFEIRYNPIRHQDRLVVSTLGLRFTAEPRHFWHGAMKLRCSAVISQAYSMSSEEIIVGDNAKASAVVGDGPVISGGKPKYQKGDTVDVNCTSAKSNPPAELKWYINDKPVRAEFLVRYKPVRYPDGQVTSILGLRFAVRTDHFLRDEMRLKCTATLSKVINMSSEETLVGSSQQSSGLHISENTGAVINRGSTMGCLLQTLF
ncbi:ig-like domain-containing protein, partial [Trichonephila clavata]